MVHKHVIPFPFKVMSGSFLHIDVPFLNPHVHQNLDLPGRVLILSGNTHISKIHNTASYSAEICVAKGMVSDLRYRKKDFEPFATGKCLKEHSEFHISKGIPFATHHSIRRECQNGNSFLPFLNLEFPYAVQ